MVNWRSVRGVLVVAGLMAAAAPLAGCGTDESSAGAATMLTYHFRDASIPPEYHRSYIVTASDGAVRIVVDSYGDVLHDEDAVLDDQTFRSVVSEIDALGTTAPADDGCAGGTSSEMTVSDADGIVVHDISAASCGGAGTDTARLDEIVAPLLAGFDMDELLAPSE